MTPARLDWPLREDYADRHGAIVERVARALGDRRLTNAAQVEELERAMAERTGAPFCVAMASATSGMILALKALVGDRPGVILGPHFAFNATVLAALWSGRPYVGLPVDPATFNLCPKAVDEALQTREVAAVLAIGVAGNPAGLKCVEEVAAKAGAPFVVDAAPCLGSVGALGDATVISLSARKALPAGEGGLVLTRSSSLADRLRRLRQYGSLDGYYCLEAGLNARMSELHAAMALGCLPGLDNTLDRRRDFAEDLRGALRALPGVTIQRVMAGEPPAWNDVLFRVSATVRETVVRRLRGLGLEAVTFYSPLVHAHPAFAGMEVDWQGREEEQSLLASEMVGAPVHSGFGPDHVEAIASAVASSLA